MWSTALNGDSKGLFGLRMERDGPMYSTQRMEPNGLAFWSPFGSLASAQFSADHMMHSSTKFEVPYS
jgi:hypothetical protein